MNLQIKTIVLYNAKAEKRILNFNLGEVNIITGSSKTGKSSIINIIDYCLGRDSFQISAGVISDNVEWYGLICKIDEFEIFIAKHKPDIGRTSQTEAYLEIATKIVIPEMSKLIVNSNDEAIIAEISKRIGINTNLFIPKLGQTRAPLEANLSHAKFLLFQPQSIIANKDVLFYRQTDTYVAQSIKDTLQYFLGIVQEDRLQLLHDLQEKRRQYKLLKRTLEESENTKTTRVERGKGLILESIQVGLIASDISTDSVNEIINILSPLKDWKPTLVPPIVEDLLSFKQDELIINRKNFQELQSDIKAAQTHLKIAEGYIGEANQQVLRLESINLYEDNITGNRCPICDSSHSQASDNEDAIKNSLKELQSDVNLVSREKPEIDDYILKKQHELETLKQIMKQQEFDINALIADQEVATHFRDTNNRIARVVGRISYFLEITSKELDSEIIKIQNDMSELRAQIIALEDEIDSKNLEDRKISILNIIGTEMTLLSKSLELEHDFPYRLDLNRLTVIADKPEAPIIMNQNMGSAANHLGSHLIALLALHKYFIRQKRPVPSFIVFDQPTQVYFPPDKEVDGDISILSDVDHEAVEMIFKLLFNVATETGLQIIVLEHANLNVSEFQKSIIDKIWREDNALIPKEWLTTS